MFFRILNDLIAAAMHHWGGLIKVVLVSVGTSNENSTVRGVMIADEFGVLQIDCPWRLGMVAHVRSFYLFVFLFWR